MRIITLTRGKVTTVDDELFNELMALGPWRTAYRKGKSCYAASHKGGYMHRVVFRLSTGQCPPRVDHKDGDGLNNQFQNLRPATHQQNLRNRGPNSNNLLGLKGVSQTDTGRFCAWIHSNGKRFHLGVFDTPQEAASAYNAAALRLFGKFAWLNPLSN